MDAQELFHAAFVIGAGLMLGAAGMWSVVAVIGSAFKWAGRRIERTLSARRRRR